MVRPEGFEPPTLWFVAKCSIQLSYGRTFDGMQPFKDIGICVMEQAQDLTVSSLIDFRLLLERAFTQMTIFPRKERDYSF
jgi:hypothetical protein